MDEIEKTSRVTVYIHPSFNLIKWLTAKEPYELADDGGEVFHNFPAPTNEVGLVVPQPPRIEHETEGFFRPKLVQRHVPVRGKFIGVIRIGWKGKTEDEDGTWKMDVYGRENIDELKGLAERLADAFSVDITLSLMSEEPKKEYKSSYSWHWD